MTVTFRPDALSDYEAICEEAHYRYPGHAVKIIGRMLSVFERVEMFPRSAPEVEPPLANFPGMRFESMPGVGHHVIYYQVFESEVQIIRIIHGRMDHRAVFGEA